MNLGDMSRENKALSFLRSLPLSITLWVRLAQSRRLRVAKYYFFEGTTGTALMVTDDKTGSKLPKHPVGSWVYLKDIELTPGSKGTVGESHDEVIAAIKANGYYKWPPEKPADRK